MDKTKVDLIQQYAYVLQEATDQLNDSDLCGTVIKTGGFSDDIAKELLESIQHQTVYNILTLSKQLYHEVTK